MKKVSTTFSVSYRGASGRLVALAPRGCAAAVAAATPSRVSPGAAGVQFRADFEKVPWQKQRDSVEVKLLAQGDEVYVLAKSKPPSRR